MVKDCIIKAEGSREIVVIVEGIRLFRQELMSNFDLSVWIDCPPELALERAKARDLDQGHDEQYMKHWDTEWAPQNEEYYNTHHPDQLASFEYKEYH
jgi:uridine kinase